MEWHLVTSEYPPQTGGVSDYSALLADALARAGEVVHVWCPKSSHPGAGECDRVQVHRVFERFSLSELGEVGAALSRSGAPHRVFVQWVPHGYGWRSMNLPFCLWIWKRARVNGDEVELMVHEPSLAFGEGSRRQNVVAVVHRVMLMIVLNAVRRVWLSIPAWRGYLQRWALGRRVSFEWLPVPSNIPVAEPGPPSAGREGRVVIGHFGTYPPAVADQLARVIPRLLGRDEARVVLLLGRGGEAFRQRIVQAAPELAPRVEATGILPPVELSRRLAGCDLLVQPFPDGVSSRRSSLMAGLAHGVPVLTTSGHLTEELWKASSSVALVPAYDDDALDAEAERLLGDPTERARLASAGRQTYAERFEPTRVVERLRSASRALPDDLVQSP